MKTPNPRTPHLDALRTIAVGLLVPFHVGLMYVPFFVFIIPGSGTSPLLSGMVAFLHLWHMPLFFFISGAAARLSLQRRTIMTYTAERVSRLFVPLLVGMAVAVAPQVYLERRWWWGLEEGFFAWYPAFWTTGFHPTGNLTWNHLWFIVYLFTFSLITMPLFERLRGVRLPRLRLWWLLLPSLLTEWIFRAGWPGYQNLIDDWANVTLYLWFFVAGYLVTQHQPIVAQRWRWLWVALPPTVLIVAYVTVTGTRPQFTHGEPLYTLTVVASTVAAWAWVLALTGFAAHHITATTPTLRSMHGIAYPFYIVHQAWIVLLAYYLVPLAWGVAAEFAAIAVGTLALSTVSAYFISRVPFVRTLFGAKPRPH